MCTERECGLCIATVHESALSCVSQEPGQLLNFIWELQAASCRKREGISEPDSCADLWLLFLNEAGGNKEGSGGGREKSAVGRPHHALDCHFSLSHMLPLSSKLASHQFRSSTTSSLTDILFWKTVYKYTLWGMGAETITQGCFPMQVPPCIPLQSCRVSGSRRPASHLCSSLPGPCLQNSIKTPQG